jgi:hypothetical protein
MDLEINKWYPIQEFQNLVDKQKADQLLMRGYVLQSDIMSGWVRVVPWHQASGAKEPDIKKRDPGSSESPVQIVRQRMFQTTMDKPTPLQKRTPGQRVNSLAAKMMKEVQASGILPGQNDPRVREIVGASFKEGTPVTGDMVQELATRMLERAEKQNERRKV